MDDSLAFRKIFLELIGSMDCTNTEAARMIGIDYRIYKSILQYGKLPRVRILIRIADYFDLPVDYLLGHTQATHIERAAHPTTFWLRYTALKERDGVSDYAVAQKLHISTSYTTAWKKKEYFPSLDNLLILTEVFNTSFDYLLGRTDDDAPYPPAEH